MGETLKAQAMVLTEFGAPLAARECELSIPQGKIVVAMVAAGVCGSDLHMWQGRDPRVRPPAVLGHEGVGRIVALPGPKRDLAGQPLAEGDLVIWNRGFSCGECYYCQVLKQSALCPQRWTYGINPPRADEESNSLLQGCYATHILLDPRTDFLRLPETVDPVTVVTASCSGATAAHALDLVELRPGDVVLVQGSGPLGLFAVALARSRGARVLVSGGGKDRLALAKSLGAEEVWERKETSAAARREALLAATGGRGVDVAVEAVGQPAAVQEGIELVRPGGTYLLAGFGNPAGVVSLDCFTALARRQLRLQGVWVSEARHLWQAVSLVLAAPEVFRRMVTVFPLAQANAALAAMQEREVIKAVLCPGSLPTSAKEEVCI